MVILRVTCLLSLLLLPMIPLGAHDVFCSVADARALLLSFLGGADTEILVRRQPLD